MIQLFIIAVVCAMAFMFSKGIWKAFLHFFDFVFSWFIHLKPCSCGEKTICLKCDDGKWSCVCQGCYKSTGEYSWACEAKRDWNRGER